MEIRIKFDKDFAKELLELEGNKFFKKILKQNIKKNKRKKFRQRRRRRRKNLERQTEEIENKLIKKVEEEFHSEQFKKIDEKRLKEKEEYRKSREKNEEWYNEQIKKGINVWEDENDNKEEIRNYPVSHKVIDTDKVLKVYENHGEENMHTMYKGEEFSKIKEILKNNRKQYKITKVKDEGECREFATLCDNFNPLVPFFEIELKMSGVNNKLRDLEFINKAMEEGIVSEINEYKVLIDGNAELKVSDCVLRLKTVKVNKLVPNDCLVTKTVKVSEKGKEIFQKDSNFVVFDNEKQVKTDDCVLALEKDLKDANYSKQIKTDDCVFVAQWEKDYFKIHDNCGKIETNCLPKISESKEFVPKNKQLMTDDCVLQIEKDLKDIPNYLVIGKTDDKKYLQNSIPASSFHSDFSEL